jgi:hypothetical protein
VPKELSKASCLKAGFEAIGHKAAVGAFALAVRGAEAWRVVLDFLNFLDKFDLSHLPGIYTKSPGFSS